MTHDYLVHSLRDWLTRKQKETKRGRAELLLADRSAVWNARQENRQLPSLWQWLSIRSLTPKVNWTVPQRKMMGRASRYHAVRSAALGLLLAVATAAGLATRGQVIEQRNATYAAGLVQRVLDAETAQVPQIVSEMTDYRRWVDPLLRQETDKVVANSRQQLHVSLARLPVDASQVEYLSGRLLGAAPHEVPVIRDALASHKDELLDRLWTVVEMPEKGKESQRLRGAAALAKYDPQSERWGKAGAFVVQDLVLENPVFLGQWSEAFRPVKNRLLPQLSEIFRGHQPERTAERSLATNLLADYAADRPQVLADLLMDADEKQFAVVFPKLKDQAEQGWPVLSGEIDQKLPPDAQDDAKEKLAKRQANAATALLEMDRPEKVWPLLKHSPDPRVRSYLIHRFFPLGADAGTILKRLDVEPDLTIRRALLLSLGEYRELEISPEDRNALLSKLLEIYRNDPDPGLHAAAEWLLRQDLFGQRPRLKQINEEWAKGAMVAGDGSWVEGRQAFFPATRHPPPTTPRWYVNGQGQTMVVVPGPVEFMMGSPLTETNRYENELTRKWRIGRTFALAAKGVTVEEYRRFDKDYTFTERNAPTPDCPVIGVSWYQSAAYCNWLSKQEGIPEDQWCYEIKGDETKLKAHDRSLAGYRLPTEAEMEYATRAGAVTARYYGETDELLPRYAWHLKNSQERTWPVGSLKPNDLGLFDAHGNAYTWCQESFQAFPRGTDDEAVDDQDVDIVIAAASYRVLRGGSYLLKASDVRSAFRYVNVAANRNSINGFRPARTLTPAP